jgi:hydroxymethylbilane synthase
LISRKLRIGTRGSRLALAQTKIVTDLLSEATKGLDIQVVPVKTRGDALLPGQRGETDGKGIFTEDIESMLLNGDLDLAVHSMKDLPVKIDPALEIAASPPRGDPRDALVSKGDRAINALPTGASLGTSSLRRKAQLRALRSDLRVVDIHGNVETRIRKIDELGIDGVVLAAAGLDRLSLGEKSSQRFSTSELVPAAGQGALAVEARGDDHEVTKLVSRINDLRTMASTKCEREFAREMGADCTLPIGAFASFNGRSITLTGMIASTDGTNLLKRSVTSTEPTGLGSQLGREMLRLGGDALTAGEVR